MNNDTRPDVDAPALNPRDLRFDRNDAYARSVQTVRHWLRGRLDQLPSFQLAYMGLDGAPIHVDVDRGVGAYKDDLADMRLEDLPRNCWWVRHPALEGVAYLPGQSAWSLRNRPLFALPQRVLWVVGNPVLAAAADTLDDVLVVGVDTRILEPAISVEEFHRLAPDAFTGSTKHVVLRIDCERGGNANEARGCEVDPAHNLANCIERLGESPVLFQRYSVTWRTLCQDGRCLVSRLASDLAVDALDRAIACSSYTMRKSTTTA